MPNQSINELLEAFSNLPPAAKAQIQELASVAQEPTPAEPEIDSVTIKFELVKFCSDLQKHNQGVNWETNKQKPKKIEVEDIIVDSQRLFEFLTS